jgi:hypothetical protein
MCNDSGCLLITKSRPRMHKIICMLRLVIMPKVVSMAYLWLRVSAFLITSAKFGPGDNAPKAVMVIRPRRSSKICKIKFPKKLIEKIFKIAVVVFTGYYL